MLPQGGPSDWSRLSSGQLQHVQQALRGGQENDPRYKALADLFRSQQASGNAFGSDGGSGIPLQPPRVSNAVGRSVEGALVLSSDSQEGQVVGQQNGGTVGVHPTMQMQQHRFFQPQGFPSTSHLQPMGVQEEAEEDQGQNSQSAASAGGQLNHAQMQGLIQKQALQLTHGQKSQQLQIQSQCSLSAMKNAGVSGSTGRDKARERARANQQQKNEAKHAAQMQGGHVVSELGHVQHQGGGNSNQSGGEYLHALQDGSLPTSAGTLPRTQSLHAAPALPGHGSIPPQLLQYAAQMAVAEKSAAVSQGLQGNQSHGRSNQPPPLQQNNPWDAGPPTGAVRSQALGSQGKALGGPIPDALGMFVGAPQSSSMQQRPGNIAALQQAAMQQAAVQHLLSARDVAGPSAPNAGLPHAGDRLASVSGARGPSSSAAPIAQTERGDMSSVTPPPNMSQRREGPSAMAVSSSLGVLGKSSQEPAQPPGRGQGTGQSGFTPEQLTVLRSQILAFRRLKRGDRVLEEATLASIVPVPLPNRAGLPNNPFVEAPAMVSVQRTTLAVSGPLDSAPMNNAPPEKLAAPVSAAKETLTKAERRRLRRRERAAELAAERRKAAAAVTGGVVACVASAPVPVLDGSAKHLSVGVEKSAPNLERSLATKAMAIDARVENAVAPPSAVLRSVADPATRPLPSTEHFEGPLVSYKPGAGGRREGGGRAGMAVEYDAREILVEEGLRVMERTRAERLEVLAQLLASAVVPSGLKLKLKIEQKMLQLAHIQSQLRQEIEGEQQQIEAMGERSYRKFARWCERQRQEMVRQVHTQQRLRKDKYFKEMFQWRKKLLEAQLSAKDARNVRNRGVAKIHEKMMRDYAKRADEDRNRRMEALKNNDVDAYREILEQQRAALPEDASERFEVLSTFLSQTEDYLNKLGGKISAVKEQQEREEVVLAAAAAARANNCSEEEVEEAIAQAAAEVAAQESDPSASVSRGAAVNKYYNLAHSVNEQIVRQPSALTAGVLRDYQMVGLQWMISLYNNRLNGILADEMGLGKTVQVMALIAYLMEYKGNYGPHLIIVPNAVMVNWKSELLRWLPSVNCIFYVGGKEQRAKIYQQEVMAMTFNVLVTTYEFIMRDRARLSKVDWKYIIIDEAQRMKDRESRLARDLDRFRCQRRLLLTGTPLQNDLHELWSLLNLLLPEVFDNSKVFHDWFATPFQNKDGNGGGGAEEDDWLETEKKVIVIHRLHQILEPFMLRRRVEDVEGSLPAKVSVVLKCKLSPYQSAVYDWVKATGTLRVDPADEALRIAGTKRASREYAPLQNKCMELRKVCNHPYLTYAPRGYSIDDDVIRSCGKLYMLDRILVKLQKTGHRVLLFSTMTRLLDILEEYLQWRGLTYRRIDGTTTLEAREDAIVDFNAPNSSCFIFLLSIRAAGRGLNLQTADTVVIYDPDPNPKNEEQAVARAHRIGQKREVRVIYMEAVVEKTPFFAREEVDEREESEDEESGRDDRYVGTIETLVRDQIQQHKIDMADEVINAGRFDQHTTQEERRMTLEALLRDEERYQQSVHNVPTWAEVNRMIARTDEEVEIFDNMDAELEWPAGMTSRAEIPDWLRAGSKEVNAAIAATAKPSLRRGGVGELAAVPTENEKEVQLGRGLRAANRRKEMEREASASNRGSMKDVEEEEAEEEEDAKSAPDEEEELYGEEEDVWRRSAWEPPEEEEDQGRGVARREVFARVRGDDGSSHARQSAGVADEKGRNRMESERKRSFEVGKDGPEEMSKDRQEKRRRREWQGSEREEGNWRGRRHEGTGKEGFGLPVKGKAVVEELEEGEIGELEEGEIGASSDGGMSLDTVSHRGAKGRGKPTGAVQDREEGEINEDANEEGEFDDTPEGQDRKKRKRSDRHGHHHHHREHGRRSVIPGLDDRGHVHDARHVTPPPSDYRQGQRGHQVSPQRGSLLGKRPPIDGAFERRLSESPQQRALAYHGKEKPRFAGVNQQAGVLGLEDVFGKDGCREGDWFGNDARVVDRAEDRRKPGQNVPSPLGFKLPKADRSNGLLRGPPWTSSPGGHDSDARGLGEHGWELERKRTLSRNASGGDGHVIPRGAVKMTDSAEKKCKLVLQKLLGALDKEGRRLATVFMELPKQIDHPEYYHAISKPVDALTIERRLEAGDYATVGGFAEDVQLMLENAMFFHGQLSKIHADARRLQSIFALRMGQSFPELDFQSVKERVQMHSHVSDVRQVPTKTQSLPSKKDKSGAGVRVGGESSGVRDMEGKAWHREDRQPKESGPEREKGDEERNDHWHDSERGHRHGRKESERDGAKVGGVEKKGEGKLTTVKKENGWDRAGEVAAENAAAMWKSIGHENGGASNAFVENQPRVKRESLVEGFTSNERRAPRTERRESGGEKSKVWAGTSVSDAGHESSKSRSKMKGCVEEGLGGVEKLRMQKVERDAEVSNEASGQVQEEERGIRPGLEGRKVKEMSVNFADHDDSEGRKGKNTAKQQKVTGKRSPMKAKVASTDAHHAAESTGVARRSDDGSRHTEFSGVKGLAGPSAVSNAPDAAVTVRSQSDGDNEEDGEGRQVDGSDSSHPLDFLALGVIKGKRQRRERENVIQGGGVQRSSASDRVAVAAVMQEMVESKEKPSKQKVTGKAPSPQTPVPFKGKVTDATQSSPGGKGKPPKFPRVGAGDGSQKRDDGGGWYKPAKRIRTDMGKRRHGGSSDA